MDFLDLAKSRYTTKSYDPTQKIAKDKIEQLKQIIRLSPSSINSQPWTFTFVEDETVKNELAAVSYWNAEKINKASQLVVFSAIDDVEAFESQIQERLLEGPMAFYNDFVKPKGETAIKSWLQHQVYLSLGFFLSACASLEIDSTPMEGIQNEAYDNILKIDGYKSLFAVAIGYRDPADFNQPSLNPKSRLDSSDVINVI
ncbi:nitroreductase family protein [Sphingobacterium sp. MYb382]|uniref:nitroreductase family protein n=1 Tax=Sphingobacterium sp. MYb382 TaxID=2745278 RepID=UPI0030A752B9